MAKTINRATVLNQAKKKEKITAKDIVSLFGVSRPWASTLINKLVKDGELIKIGKASKTFYVLPQNLDRISKASGSSIEMKVENKGLEEHKILSELENSFPALSRLKDNVRSIFTYAFSEMLNNAIEHSESKNIKITVAMKEGMITFSIADQGIGAFRNVKNKRGLNSELEAMQDLMKGKTTTQPQSHSGEGIFFTSKVGDFFSLRSFEYEMIIDNKINDIFFNKKDSSLIGTKVTFLLDTHSEKHLNDVFKEYVLETDGYGFDKTEIKVKLFTVGGIYVSRSQARRILAGLEKFKSIVLDFDKVPMVGQAFADEVFRVFKIKHPEIEIAPINMNEGVDFMINRVEMPKK